MQHTDSTNVKSGKALQSERTRAALVAAGRELFAARGYAGVATEEIVGRAGVTRGALYHQFRGGKQDLFRAVFEAVEAELTERVAVIAIAQGAEEPVAALAAGADAFLELCLTDEVQRITLIDAPAVLGWDEWRAIGARYGLGIIRAGLEAAMDTGAIARGSVEPLAHVLMGAIDEAAMYLARAPDPVAAHAEVSATVRRLLDGLRA